jgi:hypothetical protein
VNVSSGLETDRKWLLVRSCEKTERFLFGPVGRSELRVHVEV